MSAAGASITVLVERELRELVALGEAELAAVEAVYPVISRGEGSMPPIQRIDVPASNGEIDIKSAYLPGYAGIAVKISTGFFDNPARGLASLGGLMLVLDASTGAPRAALFDNGYLTDLRTALAGAVAARHLSRPEASTVGIVGAGAQARLQLEALRLVRPLRSVRVWARRDDAAAGFAARVAAELGLEVSVVSEPAATAAEGGIVITTTPATEPLLDGSCVRPGLHITAVGSDAEHKQELAPALIAAADLFVCDRRSQSARLGELRAALSAGVEPGREAELGEIVAGTVPGRRGVAEVTICDLTGTGAQDTAIASLAVERAAAAGRGTAFVI